MKYAIELLEKANNKEEALEALRKTFSISLAAFTMMETLTNCFGQSRKSYMHVLHECMVLELKKNTPDEKHVIELLEAMEIEANR